MNTSAGLPAPTKIDGLPLGRPHDRSSDALILSTTVDLLAERAYERVTMDEVAARTGKAKTTLYRRWATKDDLVIAAIRSAGHPPEIDHLPDRGSLRLDLLAVVDSPWLGGATRRISILRTLISAARSSEELADVVRAEITEPYIEIYRRLFDRAIDSGEIPRELAARVPVLADVLPAMSAHRLSFSREPVERDFFVSVIDDVILAALGHSPR
ncbi:TetR/AcrR family transcriptional regulator [Subtercola vilae]|uniref:TetR/AcrR family transcriptional regulator n=1 Tax=Subtercola vilae TaxID=2056433 RepID=A0A4T2BRP2_9MICO|nr:TetR/AcrR family transcriptional regulator [Subtercola vilae]TIH33021.1 TetR/AcrR family transcriptional regulator [Subtercola vilae]